MSGFLAGALSGLGPWAASLQPASWRGVPFAVRASQIQRGRRVALHEYPYRDTILVEDLGRGKRSVSFEAFLIGDDVYAQRDAMSAAMDIAGPGVLVHPSLGSLNVVCTLFTASEAAERGRVVTLELSFLETGQDTALYPTQIVSTQTNVVLQAANAALAAVSDFLSDVATAVQYGEAVLSAGLGVVSSFASLVSAAMGDVSLIAGLATGLPGINGGRYASGKLVTPQPDGTTIASAIAALSAARVTAAIDTEAAEAATPANLPGALQTVCADVAAAAVDPADQVRLLSSLAAFQPAVTTSSAPIGAAIGTMQTEVGTACRRAALTVLAQSCAAYQPSSYNDAIAILDAVTALLDAEIVVAADAGDTNSYLALRALRTAVTQDLAARGSQLPKLVTVRRGTALPSLVLAYQLYGDATRSDDLIARVDPPAPLFMPTEFQALSS